MLTLYDRHSLSGAKVSFTVGLMPNPTQLEVRLQLLPVPSYTVFSVAGDVESMFGYCASSFLQGEVSFPSLTHPEDQDVLEVMFRISPQPATSPKSQVCNLRVRQANGRIRCLVVQYDPELTVAGPLLNLWLRDAKSLFDPADALTANPGFRSMMENTNDFIFFKDRNHVFTSASQTLVSVTQPSVHWTDLIGQTDYDVFPEEYADIYYRLEKQVFAGLTVAHEIQHYETRDGSKGWIDNRKYPIRNVQGEITGLFSIARVITEQVRAEQALRQERETLQLILDYAPIGIWLQDGNGKIAFVNKAFCQATGIAEAQFRLVNHYTELIPEAFRPQCLASDARALASASVSVTHQQLPFVDGQIHDLRIIKAVKRDVDQRPVALVGLSLDITEEIRKEQTLRLERDSTRNILETVETMIVALDTEGRITLLNRKGCQLLGYTEDELIGRDWFTTCLPRNSDVDQVRDVFKMSLAGNLAVAEYFENPVRSRNGEERLIAWHNSTIRDKDGNVIGGLSAGEDITERRAADARLFKSEAKYRHLIENSHDIIYSLTSDGMFTYVSPAWTTLLGHPVKDIEGHLFTEFVHADDIPACFAFLQRVLETGQPQEGVEYRVQHDSGKWLWHASSATPVKNTEGLVTGYEGVARDITERKAAQARLLESEQQHRLLLENLSSGVVVHNSDTSIQLCNAMAVTLLGLTQDQLAGMTALDSRWCFLWGDATPMPRADYPVNRVLASGEHLRNYLVGVRRHDRTDPTWLLCNAYPIRDDAGYILQVVVTFTDITERKAYESQLERIAHFDSLTSLPNRVLLTDRLQQALVQAQRRQQKLALAYLDLDGFKAINDHHGHQTGDQVLITLARRMKEALREGDTMARIGGDEFVAVLIDLQDNQASIPLLSRLLAAAAEPVQVGKLTLQVSASLGVTFYPQAQDLDADQLLRQADQAMYRAKVAGKNRYHVFDAVQDSTLRNHHESLERIRLALENHEFVLYYQPKVNMHSGQVVGAEALIRWQHPEKGLLAPALFLPVIEDDPLAVDVGEWVIDTALTQIERWHATGLDLPVSVNIGARQLQQGNFVARLQAILARHPQVQPGCIELEVLETSALADMAQVSKVIGDCAEMGIRFALDDFGTGYSSLTYLKRLRVTLLKIDQSFVRDMLDDPEDLAILQGVIGLAAAFQREVIAEGVETVAHGSALLQLGCELGQGYGIARPMPPDQMPGWAAAWRAPPTWASCQQISQDNQWALNAAVEHRAWILAQEHYIKGERAAPPPLDPHLCRFGLWLEAERRAGRGDQPGINATNALHRQIHTLADELCQLFKDGYAVESVGRLGELHRLRDALLGQMKALETSR